LKEIDYPKPEDEVVTYLDKELHKISLEFLNGNFPEMEVTE
jgi:hypothetical protein